MSKRIKESYGYLGLFLIISVWGVVALAATFFYPLRPSPESILSRKLKKKNAKKALNADNQVSEDSGPV